MNQFDESIRKQLAVLLRVMNVTRCVKEDNIPCKIEEGLFLGSIGAANNKNALKSLNVTHILTVASSLPPAHPNDFEYKVINGFACLGFSVTIVVAYLMKKHGMSLSQALEHVKSRRPLASPNSGFISQLTDFEKSLQDEKNMTVK